MIWQHTYGSAGVDIGYEIIRGLNNDFFITGKYGGQADNYYLLHLNDDGWASINEKTLSLENTVFPNPTKGMVYFNREVTAVQVYNTLGQTVFSENNFETNSIDLSFLNDGLYNCKIAYLNQSVANYLISISK